MTDLYLPSFKKNGQPPGRYQSQIGKWPAEQCAPALFSQQAAASPDAIALVYEESHLTFAEVERRSNQLARILRARGIGPERLVGVALERSPELLLVLLGVMKAGGAYVPLDPDYPAERLAYMLEDSGIGLLITREALGGHFPSSLPVLALERLWDLMSQESSEPLADVVEAEHLAYVIYTSGSTGRPKGVEVIHRGLRNLIWAQRGAFAVRRDHRVLQFASVNFDASVSEVFVTLLAGATLCMGPRSRLLPGTALTGLLREQAISMVTLPPSALAMLKPEEVELETLIVAGEACPLELARRWAGQCRFINAYGPTEYTVCATTGIYEASSPLFTMGYPIANTWLAILDEHWREVPAGEEGELYLGGAGLARGYLGRPELTAERFVPDPDSPEPGARLYRTGDRVRALPDGRLEFLGRVDQQVKLRGYRIELGEIEHALRAQPGVREAAALVREDNPGDARLVAYLVPAENERISPAALRAALKQTLPEYMLPSAFVLLEALPLLENGKLNRRALPAPGQERPELATPYVAARTEIERALEQIWSTVLGVNQIGIHDNFFELGGHSLRATLLQGWISERFAQDIPLTSIFAFPTIAELAHVLEEQMRDGGQQSVVQVQRAPRTEPLPLSFAQERIWFVCQLKPDNLAYNAQAVIRLSGELDIEALRRALTEIVRRHEMFRTTFPTLDGRPVQMIHPAWQVPLPVHDLSTLPADEREAAARELTGEEGRWHFEITQLPLVRWTLYRLSEREHFFCYVEHHLIHDGWSFTVFLRDLQELYTAFREQKPSPLPEPALQFADFAWRQRQWLHTDADMAEKQRAYWQAKLADLPEGLQLPYDRPRPPVPSLRGAALRVPLPLSLAQQLRALSRQEGVTLFMLMLAAFKTLLYRYSGQEDLPVGSSVANRHWKGTKHLIGVVLNSIVLRTQLSDDMTFRELLQQVRTVTVEAYQHQDLPFDKVVEAVHPTRDLSYNPLFQVAFNFHDSPMPELRFPDLKLDIQEAINNGSSKFDLSLTVIPRAEQQSVFHQEQEQNQNQSQSITLVWEYSTDLFVEATIARMFAHFQQLLASIVANPEQKLAVLPMLDAAEYHELLELAAGPREVWPDAAFVHEMVSRQAARTPHALALTYGDTSLTYAELERRSNQLTHVLRQRGIGPDALVAVALERSPELVLALLSVLKAGGAHVPLDPAYPAERLAYMLEDSAATLVITHSSLRATFSTTTPLLCLDEAWDLISQQDTAYTPPALHRENLAYVLYTSGSTGKPKGVQIPHRGLTNFMLSARLRPGIRAEDHLLAVTTLSFDIAELEIYLPLITGAQIILSSREEAADGEQLAANLRTRDVSIMQATPATWRLLLEAGWPGSPALRVICGGEAFPRDLAEYLLARTAGVWNIYGPTETTIWSTLAQLHADEQKITIGRPVANTPAYILDRTLRPVPAGVVGELYLGGAGLGRGYRGRPDLTSERFLPDPFSAQEGARMYRTGDLARYLPDGRLECLGRVDHQVKLRGFRIELGEIEHSLRAQPGVREAVVILREDSPGNQRLVAYLVAEQGYALEMPALRAALKQLLPDYMLPSAFVMLDALPLLANGKLNRHALPAPDQERPDLAAPFIAARSATEQQLARVWSEVLNLSRVGIHDNFFDLGGHSLLIPRVYSRLRTQGYADLTIVDLFHYPTIKLLAEHLERTDQIEERQSLTATYQARAATRRDLLKKQGELRQQRRA
ncbi:MAG TPA: amino acid adenylation domain-containing protein [Ktedonobacteraceae bacterium]|nr:amino acid adenylation domain-containing protein [Ktedonobacteraceae bacterium]